ncbi:hypothetical protein AM1_1190 [Acaryochloris marina MBIC11017]|uniref:Uncharacterized protein n=1 Tax=Acaryochloris marina (strain MBIC 11017) TaxID=329726 RepID=B0C3W7_ACAM1|nr:hypothetical protein AM1_1190 [Acaryochloris marina MBIC11017]
MHQYKYSDNKQITETIYQSLVDDSLRFIAESPETLFVV